ncbi:heme transporter FLVCR2-like isoform X2 [Bacillus rossius redtenbacheri]|uniref:heme transporter FLVCR2-like isoform X2 n=1 Tax=Bacillus rossius redtenbacheri TaxID=93214 RepID=UPI002FDCF621
MAAGQMEYVEVPRAAAKERVLLADMRIEVSPRRWLVLAAFLLFCVSTNYQWVQYTIVGDLVARYYRVPAARVDWTSLVFMGALIALMLPVSFLLEKKGVGWSTKVGALLLAVGSWLKVAAVAPDRFLLALAGQGLVGASQVFQLGSPARLAAVWFPAPQLSTACAIGVLGNEVGAAFGFLLSPLLVRPHDHPEDIGRDLSSSMLLTAGASTVIFLLVVLLFKDKPKLPPNPMQAIERYTCTPVTLNDFFRSIGVLLTNRNYLLMLASCGISGGALNVVGTILNPIILRHFPDGQELAGRVGLVMMVSGIAGIALLGVLLDITHRETALGAFIVQTVAYAGFTFVLRDENVILIYITVAFIGFSLFGYVTVAFELSAEVTYPVSESTMGCLLLIPANILGFSMTMAFTWVLEHWGDLPANILMIGCLTLGSILTIFVRKDYRRLAANTAPVKV